MKTKSTVSKNKKTSVKAKNKSKIKSLSIKTCIKSKNKKTSTLKFKKHLKSEKIFKPDTADKDDIDDFTESKVFVNSYFYKTHIQWNNLPLELKIIEDHEKFSTRLKDYLWESISMNPDNQEHLESHVSLGRLPVH